jgi:hypothetical protein
MDAVSATNGDIEPLTEVDLSPLPDEAVAYAHDQLEDRLLMDPELVGESLATDLQFNPDTGEIVLLNSPILGVIRDALSEKLRDMKREAERGARDDVTHEQYQEWCTIIREEFSNV